MACYGTAVANENLTTEQHEQAWKTLSDKYLETFQSGI